jgi:cardiolipin synthase A/B
MQTSQTFKQLTSFVLFLSLTPISAYANAQAAVPKAIAARIAQNPPIQLNTAMQLQLVHYLSSILNVNPMQAIATKKVDPLTILDLSQKETTQEEQDLIKTWADMIERDTLKSNIASLINQLKTRPTPIAPTLQKLPPAQLEYATQMLSASIEAVVKMRGLTSDSRDAKYHEWSKLSERMIKQVNSTKPGAEHVLDLAKSSWLKTEKAEILVNGPASFAKRDQFMKSAVDSINILTWSIYDDLTGTQLADLLIQKKKENPSLKIRVIVDGQVAKTPGHGAQVTRLENAGIEVIRWFSKDLTFVGQHRKMLIVDNMHMVAGGLNFGDVYSHKNPSVAGWRDTDIYIKGAGAQEGNRLFAEIWNDQIKEQNQLKYEKMDADEKIAEDNTSESPVEISIINHDPRHSKNGSTIMLTILKAIREAKQSIDIENAYIILFPALKSEIQAAINRNVKVRVFTNSSQSVDEPVVSIPILRSAYEFASMGAQVFLKNGTTLHSKVLVVDSDLSMIMSYNLHPRSERVEGEMAIAVRNKNFAKAMHDLVTQDVQTLGTAIRSANEIKIPDSAVSVPTLRIFFDML